MNPFMLFTHYLESHYERQFSYEIWLQKLDEQPLLLHHFGNSNRLAPLIPQDHRDSKYRTENKKNSVTYFYFYPNDYIIILIFPFDPDFVTKGDHDQIWLIFHLLYHQVMIEDKNKQTEKLIEGIHSISLSLDLNQLLKNIVHNALDVINAVDAGLLHLYDPKIDRLIPKGVVGFDEEKIQHFKLKVGESIAGKVYQDGKARVYDSHTTTIQGMSDISEENMYHINSSKDLGGLQSLLCVPVSIGTEKIGVMVVHKFDSDRKFLSQDLFLLQGFASQAAIAIQNARLFTQVRTTLDEMAVLSEQLKMKNEFLQQRNEIHNELIRISLQNQGISPIISFLNEMIDKPVTFYDYIENALHHRSVYDQTSISAYEIEIIILTKRTPVYIDIWDNDRKISVYIYPIWVGSVFLGYLMVETKDCFLSEIEIITIEQSTSILALELVKKQTLIEIYYKKTYEYFNELLENRDPELLKGKGKEFGISTFSFGMVIVFEIHSTGDLQKIDADIHRFILRIKKALHGREKVLFGFHHQITLLITMIHPAVTKGIIDTIQNMIREWESEGNDAISGGIGSVVEDIGNFAKSYEEAKRTLSYLTKGNKLGLLHYEELGVNRLFVHHSQQDIEKFIEEIFGPLQMKEKDSYLEQTLRIYMASDRSVSESTQKLHIHFNTLYQRLKKIEDILHVSFNNVEDVLKLQLACYLKETR